METGHPSTRVVNTRVVETGLKTDDRCTQATTVGASKHDVYGLI